MNKIEVVPYNPNWPLVFEEEAAKIREALGDNYIEIHHIGSTSVPNLAAKPIIDIISVVRDIHAIDKLAMESLGYEVKGEFGIPFRSYFTKGSVFRTHNIHIFEQGNSEIERHLKFRDWMCNNSTDKEAYSSLKKTLAKKFPNDIESYCIGKDEFIAKIDSKAGWNGFRFVMAATPNEWKEYHRIRKEQILIPINTENNFHFVLYKGTKITCVAHIEFLNKNEASIKSLATDKLYKKKHDKYMIKLLGKWIKSQKRVLYYP